MEELMGVPIETLVTPLIRHGLSFSQQFLKKIWEPSPIGSNPIDNNQKAAWDLYVEMETRIITQPLSPNHGDEQKALDSVFSLFQTTREILHEQGPNCAEFAKIAIEILNQKVRPFTAEWHSRSIADAFTEPAACAEFRADLESLQEVLRAYTRTLAVLAGVEDITSLSDTEQE